MLVVRVETPYAMKEHDPDQQQNAEALAAGRPIVDRIRNELNLSADGSDADTIDVFKALLLTERDVCIPDELIGEDLLLDIHSLYYRVFDAVREELLDNVDGDRFVFVVIDPSYEDTTTVVLCTEEQVLLMYWCKAWNFYWETEDAMAKTLGELYQEAAHRLSGVGSPKGEREA